MNARDAGFGAFETRVSNPRGVGRYLNVTTTEVKSTCYTIENLLNRADFKRNTADGGGYKSVAMCSEWRRDLQRSCTDRRELTRYGTM